MNECFSTIKVLKQEILVSKLNEFTVTIYIKYKTICPL